jgi:hypothetical protein
MARKFIATRPAGTRPPGHLAQPSGFVPPEDFDFVGTAVAPPAAGAVVGETPPTPAVTPEPVQVPVRASPSMISEPRRLTEAEAAALPPDPFALARPLSALPFADQSQPVILADDPAEAARQEAIRRYGPDAAARAFQPGSRPKAGQAFHERREAGVIGIGRAELVATRATDDQRQGAEAPNSDLVRAQIVRDGKKAEREIGAARQAALRAWDAWRNVDVFKVRDARTGETKTVFQPNRPATQTMGVVYEDTRDEHGNLVKTETFRQKLVANDETYPDLMALRATAEEADRLVLSLQDAIDIMKAMTPTLYKRSLRG